MLDKNWSLPLLDKLKTDVYGEKETVFRNIEHGFQVKCKLSRIRVKLYLIQFED